jgi:hypothetical protein
MAAALWRRIERRLRLGYLLDPPVERGTIAAGLDPFGQSPALMAAISAGRR